MRSGVKSQLYEQDLQKVQQFYLNHFEVSYDQEEEGFFGLGRHFSQPSKMVFQITQEDIKKNFLNSQSLLNGVSSVDQIDNTCIHDQLRANVQSKNGDNIYSGLSSSEQKKFSALNNGNPFENISKDGSKQQIKKQHNYDHVFRKNSKQKKNTNFPKILVSNFQKYIRNSGIQMTRQHSILFMRARKIYAQKGIRNIKIQALQTLFGESQLGQSFTRVNREILFTLLGLTEFKIESIFQSRSMKEKNRRQHLLAAKVYRLRCRSKKLTGRVQSK